MTRESSPSAAVAANPGTDARVGADRQLGRSIATLARRLWPRKTAEELAYRGCVTKRQAERWLSEESGVSAEVIVLFLQSDAGFDFLEELVKDAKPAWWRSFQRRVALDRLAAERDALNNRARLLQRGGTA